ncbi:MAG: antibiotic biosynthesis monooxygenase [Myxococcota bacterium]
MKTNRPTTHTIMYAATLAAVALVGPWACTSDPHDPRGLEQEAYEDETGTGEASETPTDTTDQDPDGMEEPPAEYLRCQDEDLESQAQFAGPLYDSTRGGLIGTPAERYIAATTLFNYRPEVYDRFLVVVDDVLEQARESPGFVGYELAYSAGCRYGRTITVWESEAAMIDFMLTGAHGEAMAQVRELGNDGRTIDWEITPDELPISWETARQQLAPILP